MKEQLKKIMLLIVITISVAVLFPIESRAAERSNYGRNVLASMPNAKELVYAYDQIAAGVEEAKVSISVYDGANNLSEAEFAMVMDVYVRDYPEHFWLGNRYPYSTNDDTILTFFPVYLMSGSELTTSKEMYERKVQQILSGISSQMSDYEKEVYIHDKLASMITYVESSNAHNAYGALVEGKAVCEGYAESFQDLLRRVGIEGFIALGASENPTTGVIENHEWNYVKIDGKFYHVDLTWNDQGEVYHAYFNRSDATIRKDHMITSCDYKLPACDSEDAFYFKGKNTNLNSYTVEMVGELLKQNDLKVHVYVPADVQAFTNWFYDNILDIAQCVGITGQFSAGSQVLENEVVLELEWDGYQKQNPFEDVPNTAYYKDAVLWAVENGITNGTGEGQFSPDMTCSRSQIVTFLWRAAGSPSPQNSENPFKDVPNSAYYKNAVLWAVENGITNGTGAGEFSPDMPCTRSQVVTLMWRANGKPQPVNQTNSFKDVLNGAYYKDAVLWAVENEITNGTGGGNFSPEMKCTRSQIVTLLWRAEK